jgi:prepilin-type N-terminal cleavage/methylation domain-containing protein
MDSHPGFICLKKSNPKGFSIIECLIALSVFTIGILAVATLVLSSIGENASARRITEATALAEVRLEQLMALPYGDIAADSETQGAYTVAWEVTEGAIIAETKSITVTVSWWFRGRQRDVTVRHLLSPLA